MTKRENPRRRENIEKKKNKEYSDYAEKFLNDMMTTSREFQQSIMGQVKVGEPLFEIEVLQ